LCGDDPVPWCHQVTELPPIQPFVNEYRRHTLICPHCGEATRAELPPGVPEGAFGPRLQAFVAVCTGRYQLSKRQAQELLADGFAIDVALGSVCHIERSVRAAVAVPVGEAREALKQEAVVNADETSFPDTGWLWLGVTAYLAVLLIRQKRDAQSALALWGSGFSGIAGSDRYASDNGLAPGRRPLCWAHLDRDWQAFLDRGGPSARLERPLQAWTDERFALWYRVRDGTMSPGQFRYEMIPIRGAVGEWLRAGPRCAHAPTAGTCTNILKREESLWTFVEVEGVEPTNNAAERAWRQAVLWRRKSLGTRSRGRATYVERMLTVVTTCRLQGRNALEYVTAACEAALRGQAAPSLLPAKAPGRRAG
jgi:transposase